MKRREVIRQNHATAKTAPNKQAKKKTWTTAAKSVVGERLSQKGRVPTPKSERAKARDLPKIIKLAWRLVDAIDRGDMRLIADMASKIYEEAA
jgi:hypothetical protein